MKNKAVWVIVASTVLLIVIGSVAAGFVQDGTIFEKANAATAPIIGILGALLLFISFREQVKANRLQFTALNEQRELELMYRFYEEVKTDLLRMQEEYGRRLGQSSLLDSYMNFIIDDKHSQYPEFDIYVKYVLRQFGFLCKRITRDNRDKTLSDSEIAYLVDKVEYQFSLYFGQYRDTLKSKGFNTEFSIQFRNSFLEANKEIEGLEEIRKQKKKP